MPVPDNIQTLVKQLLKYAAIGISTNFAGYMIYLLVTYFWLSPKVAMTVLYAVGATVGYFANRRLTFGYSKSILGSSVRYIIAHVGGYLMNLAILIVFVDQLGYAHHVVQGVSIFCVAAYLFVTFKLFVFPAERGTR